MKHGVWTKISYYWRKQREFKSMEKLQEEEEEEEGKKERENKEAKRGHTKNK